MNGWVIEYEMMFFHYYLTQNSKRVSFYTFTLLLIKKSGDICDRYSLIAEYKSTWGRSKEKTVIQSTPAMKSWALKSLHMFRQLLLIVEYKSLEMFAYYLFYLIMCKTIQFLENMHLV